MELFYLVRTAVSSFGIIQFRHHPLARMIRRRAPPLSKSPYSTERAALRAVLIEARDAAGMRQKTLAKKLGRSQSFIAKYEAGDRRIEVTEFVAISRAMGADPVALLRKLLKKIG